MSSLAKFVRQFEGAPLTTIVHKDKPWWVAREVGAVMGYSAAGKRLVDKIAGGWAEDFDGADRWLVDGEDLKEIQDILRGTESAPLGQGSLLLLSESGVNKVAILSRKPEGRRLRDWLAKEVLPEISRTGAYAGAPALPPIAPVTRGGSLIENVRLLLAAVEQLDEQGRRLESVETKVRQIEAAQVEASEEMHVVERAEGHAPGLTTRAKVVRLHRAYCVAKPADFQEVWNWLYTELKYRHNFDAKIRAKHRGCKPLDVVEQDGMMQVFYVLASDLLVVRERHAA